MTNQKNVKQCQWMGCGKEVFVEKALFCGEHDKKGREQFEGVVKIGLSAVALVTIGAKLLKKIVK